MKLMMRTLTLRFDLGTPRIEMPDAVDADWVLERSLELGFGYVRLNWAGLFEVDLPIEDDVMFIAMAYAELDEFCRSGTSHHLFLGDGLLDVRVERDDQTVMITVCHTPHLDRRFSEEKTITTQLSSYQYAWWRLMKDLMVELQPSGERAPA